MDFFFLRRDFEISLGQIKWPYLSAASEPISQSKDLLNKLMIGAEHLFLVCIFELRTIESNENSI